MASCLIICEKTQRWAIPLRTALRCAGEGGKLAPQEPRIAETRSLAQAEAAWCESPGSMLAIEVTTANLAGVVGLLLRIGRQPRGAVIALLDEETAAAEALLREAGAVGVCRTPLDAPAAARLIRRHWERTPAADDPATDVSSRLPWPDFAASAGKGLSSLIPIF